MKTLREQLLEKQALALQKIHNDSKKLPKPILMNKMVENEFEELIPQNDYVKYDPETDEFSIYVHGRRLEFKGSEFDWIFDYLLRIGSKVPTFKQTFIDRDMVIETEVISGCEIDFPELEKEGDEFIGWFKTPEWLAGEEIVSGSVATSDQTMFACWKSFLP